MASWITTSLAGPSSLWLLALFGQMPGAVAMFYVEDIFYEDTVSASSGQKDLKQYYNLH